MSHHLPFLLWHVTFVTSPSHLSCDMSYHLLISLVTCHITSSSLLWLTTMYYRARKFPLGPTTIWEDTGLRSVMVKGWILCWRPTKGQIWLTLENIDYHKNNRTFSYSDFNLTTIQWQISWRGYSLYYLSYSDIKKFQPSNWLSRMEIPH